MVSHAQFPCAVLYNTRSACPNNSNCLVNTHGVINSDTGICGANLGATIPCPNGTCGGGSVFTATPNGLACNPHDGCEYGLSPVAKRIMQENHIGKAYTVGCHGEIRVLLGVNRPQPAKSASPVARESTSGQSGVSPVGR
jgi:hypothetical protein